MGVSAFRGQIGNSAAIRRCPLYPVCRNTSRENGRSFLMSVAGRNITFEKLVADSTYDVAKQFMPTDYLKWRMRIINVSPANAKQEAEKVDKSENHIPTFFLFAKNEADQGKIKDTVTAIFDKVGERCIVVDFSSC